MCRFSPPGSGLSQALGVGTPKTQNPKLKEVRCAQAKKPPPMRSPPEKPKKPSGPTKDHRVSDFATLVAAARVFGCSTDSWGRARERKRERKERERERERGRKRERRREEEERERERDGERGLTSLQLVHADVKFQEIVFGFACGVISGYNSNDMQRLYGHESGIAPACPAVCCAVILLPSACITTQCAPPAFLYNAEPKTQLGACECERCNPYCPANKQQQSLLRTSGAEKWLKKAPATRKKHGSPPDAT